MSLEAPPASAASLVPVSGGIDLTVAIQTAAALGKDGVEVIERLHAIRREERTAAAKAAFVRAMAAVQSEMRPIVKTYTGQHEVKTVVTTDGRKKRGLYAPFEAIAAALAPVIAANGIAYRFDRESRDQKEYVICIVSHADGHEQVASRFPAPADTGPGRNAIQAIASGETYAKRYALIDAFGITTADPDDDAEEHGRSADASATITASQASAMRILADQVKANVPKFLSLWDASTFEEVRAADFDRAMRMLEQKRPAAGASR